MANKDFQKGFAMGFASGGVNPSPLTEEYIAEFKEKEIDYVKSYTYNLAEFEGKTSSDGEKIIELLVQKSSAAIDGVNSYIFAVGCLMRMFERVGDNPVKRLADSPFKLIINNGRLEGVSNYEDVFDVEFTFADGSKISLKRSAEGMVDGEPFFKGDTFCDYDSSQTEARDTYELVFAMRLYTTNEAIVNSMVEEYTEVIENGYVTNVILYYQNQPEIENVDAHYLGGE